MKIAISFQNQREITGHAGKASRFLIFTVDPEEQTILEREVINLPPKDILHNRFHNSENPYSPHLIFDVDIVITGGAGAGFVNRLASQGVQVIITSEKDPETAIDLLFKGELPSIQPHEHHH